MIRRLLGRFGGFFLIAIAGGVAVIGLSQFTPAAAQQSPGLKREAPKESKPGVPDAAPPPSDSQAQARKLALGESLPDNPAERARLLDNLYALLSTALDEQSAEETSKAIMRLWRATGSDTISVLMDRAQKAAGEKNTGLALKLLDSVVELAPDYAEGWSQRAYLLYMENNVDRALGDLRRALALDPNHFRALDALGHILREIGQKKAAFEAFDRLNEVHPFWPGAKQAVEELGRDVGGQGI
jgi:tetratricopeptide (TPR) repeat protein